jgi:hypothetical protein
MRALLLTGFSAFSMNPPRLADEQIVAGPDWPDAQTSDGRWLSLRTPAGEYDLAGLLAKIPKEQMPHQILCLSDVECRNKPRNLSAFYGQKTLFVMKGEQTKTPLAEIIRYSVKESFSRVMLVSDKLELEKCIADLRQPTAADFAQPAAELISLQPLPKACAV